MQLVGKSIPQSSNFCSLINPDYNNNLLIKIFFVILERTELDYKRFCLQIITCAVSAANTFPSSTWTVVFFNLIATGCQQLPVWLIILLFSGCDIDFIWINGVQDTQFLISLLDRSIVSRFYIVFVFDYCWCW